MSDSPHDGLKHYLLGEPIKAGVGVSPDGQLLYVQKHIMNPTSILTLIISGILLTIYMWFYVSPLLRGQGPTAVKREIVIDTEMNFHSDTENTSLITWIHRSSLGRFIDITGRFKKIDENSTEQVNYHHLRPPLSRDSSYLSTTLTPPPPAYAPRSDSFGPSELKRHHSESLSLPGSPTTEYIPCAQLTRGSSDASSLRHSLQMPSPRTQPPSPLHLNFTGTGSEGRRDRLR